MVDSTCECNAAFFWNTTLQRCVIHLKRGMLNRVRHGDKGQLADDLREVFRTGDKHYTQKQAWNSWGALCDKWGKDYRSIKRMKTDLFYRDYYTCLDFHPRIHAMIYTANRIERLQKDFRRVTRIRSALPSEEAVILLMWEAAMDKKAYLRVPPAIDFDKKTIL